MKIVIATPVYGEPHPAFQRSLAETREALGVNWLELPGCADIVLARNRLLHIFRHEIFGHGQLDDAIIFIDADISWSLNDLRLVLAPLEAGTADVSTGMYQMKVPGPAQFVGDLLPSDCNEQEGYVGPHGHAHAYRLASTGFGFFAITRHAVEEVAKHCNSYCPVYGQSLTNKLDERVAMLFRNEISATEVQPDVPRYRGEDVSACLTLRKAGFDIWCARETKLSHHAAQQPHNPYSEQLDVDAFAKRLAFQHDVMRRKSNGESLDQNELTRRQQALPKSIARSGA